MYSEGKNVQSLWCAFFEEYVLNFCKDSVKSPEFPLFCKLRVKMKTETSRSPTVVPYVSFSILQISQHCGMRGPDLNCEKTFHGKYTFQNNNIE